MSDRKRPEEQQDEQDEDHRDRRAERRVLRLQVLGRHERSGHVALGSAERRGGDVVTRQRHEHQHQAGDDAGHGERQGHLGEGAEAVGAEVLARLTQRRLEPVEGHEQREDHQRQVVVDDAELHGEPCVEHGQGSVA